VLSIFDNNVYVSYVDSSGEEVVVSLSETAKNTYWMQKSLDEAQLASEYSHNLFTLEKLVSIQGKSLLVNLKWKFTPHQNLTDINLRIASFTEPSFDFREAYVPGVLVWQNDKKIPRVLDWQNPWDNPSSTDINGSWALVEYPPNSLIDNFAAVLDAENGVLVVFEFADIPDWLTVGAQSNRFIDSLRAGYQVGDLGENESRVIAFSVLTYSFESRQSELPTEADLKQLLHSQANLTVQVRDFLTYIKEYNVKFLVVDSERILSDVQLSPILDKVYDNGKFVIYSVRR
jgi:hypothetical protein